MTQVLVWTAGVRHSGSMSSLSSSPPPEGACNGEEQVPEQSALGTQTGEPWGLPGAIGKGGQKEVKSKPDPGG